MPEKFVKSVQEKDFGFPARIMLGKPQPTPGDPGRFIFKRFESGFPTQDGLVLHKAKENPLPWVKEYRDLLGKLVFKNDGIMNSLNGQLMSAESCQAGWGHEVEKQAIVRADLFLLGADVLSITADLVTGGYAHGHAVKRAGHAAMQDGEGIKTYIRERGLGANLFEKPQIAIGIHLFALSLRLSGVDNRESTVNLGLVKKFFSSNLNLIQGIVKFANLPLDDLNSEQVSEVVTELQYALVKSDISGISSNFWRRVVRQQPKLARGLLKLANRIEYLLFDNDFVREVERFREKMGVRAVTSTFPSTLRGYGDEHNKVRPSITTVVDPGYIFNRLLDFDPATLLEMITHGATQFAPDVITAKVMKRYYGKDAFVAGTIGDVMDKEKAVEKWWNTKKDRVILTSSSGNASSLGEMALSIRQFNQYQEEHRNSPYTLIVFVGEHDDPVLRNPKKYSNDKQPRILDEFEETNKEGKHVINYTHDTPWESIEETIRSNRGKVILFRTANVSLVSEAKLALERMALVDVAKGGEAPLMAPQVACLNLLTTPTGPNEPFNSIWGVSNGGSVFADFSDDHRPLWQGIRGRLPNLINTLKEMDLIGDSTVEAYEREIKDQSSAWCLLNSCKPGKSYSSRSNNLFEQLDDLFGDTEDKREAGMNQARRIALRGLANLKNATFAIVAAKIALANNIPLDAGFYSKLEEFYIYERERTVIIIANLFPEDAKYIIDHGSVFE